MHLSKIRKEFNMEFLNTWLQGIIVAVVIASIIQMILPNGNNKKYIKVVLGV